MPFDYPGAGRNAPVGVRQAIAHFRQLPFQARARIPLLYWLLGSGTPPYKMSQADSAYQSVPKGAQRCENCEFAYQKVAYGYFICSQIQGRIEPQGWCRLWRGAS